MQSALQQYKRSLKAVLSCMKYIKKPYPQPLPYEGRGVKIKASQE
ncbi:hypothetical protein [Microcoleus sp. FACHB-SPT15]|nr:hypothetical protein [Microcoleus sp. FACHB-SPT15]